MGGLVLAVDGGQSGIRLRISGSPEVLETQGVSRLEGNPLDTIRELVTQAVRAHNLSGITTVSLGLSVVPENETEARSFANSLVRALGASTILVTDDALTHHAAHFQGAPGICLAIGTGVACTVVDSSGVYRSVSGYGFLLGDDGGAFWIGRQAIRIILDARYSGRPAGVLARAASETFGPLDQLPAIVHSSKRPVNSIAQFARQVFSALGADPIADKVLSDACECLVEASLRASEAAGDDDLVRQIVWTSKLFGNFPLAQNALQNSLGAAFPDWRISQGKEVPLTGALWIGQNKDLGPYASHVVLETVTERTRGVG